MPRCRRPRAWERHAAGKQREQVAPCRQLSIDEQRAIITEVKDELAKRYPKNRVKADMHRVGELYDEIIDLIADPKRIPDSAFNEATYDMQASWDDWGRGYKPAPRPSTPMATSSIPTATLIPATPVRLPDLLAGRAAHVQIERAATRAQAVKALRALAAQGEAPHLKKA